MSKLAKALTAAAGNAGGEPDPDFNQVSLLLNGDGTDGGQNNTYTDSSSSGHTMTPAGTIEQGSVSPFGDNWANYFDGSDYLQIPNNTALNLSGTNWTVECWVKPDGNYSGYNAIFAKRLSGSTTTSYEGFLNITTGVVSFFNGTVYSSSTTLASNVWSHCAWVYDGTNINIYVNGVSVLSTAVTISEVDTEFVIGGLRGNSEWFYGYVSNLRIIKGTALYTSTFTPPTAPLTAISGTSLLTCQSNYFVDNSTNDFTLTVSGNPEVTSFSPFVNSEAITLAANGGSVIVNGAGDRLTTTESLGSGDFTVEFWAYTLTAGDDAFFDTRTGNVSPTGLTFTALDSDTVRLYDNAARITVNGVSYLNQWVHFAVERSSGTITVYVNGTAGGSVANTTNYSDTTFIVGDSSQYGDTDAYISNFRLVKGSAVYGGNFTPPTAPLTAITNTELLLNFEDAAIFDYAAISNLGTIGNADISTAVVKYGTGSLAFDGTGDYLDLPVNPTLSFGTGDFTIEGWINVASTDTTYRSILSIGTPVQIYARSGTIECYFDSDNSGGPYMVQALTGPASSITANTWHYFTVVRNGTTFTAYVDGVAGTPATGVTGEVALSAKGAKIGIAENLLYPFTGYIDDFRITKGLARYTSAFTPPEAALPTF